MLCFLLHPLLSFYICSCDILRVQPSFLKLASSSQDRAMCYMMHCLSAVTAEVQNSSITFGRGAEKGSGNFGHQFLNLEVSVEIFWQILCDVKCIKGSSSVLASSG